MTMPVYAVTGASGHLGRSRLSSFWPAACPLSHRRYIPHLSERVMPSAGAHPMAQLVPRAAPVLSWRRCRSSAAPLYRLREVTVGGVQCAQIAQIYMRELLIAEAG